MAIERKARALSEVAERAVPDAANLWPGIRSRITSREARGHRHGPRRLLAAGLGTALLLVLVAAISTLWGPPQPASAEAILARAQSATAATSGGRSYHLQMVSHSGVKPSSESLREAWFDGNRARQTFRIPGANGNATTVIDIIFDGTQSWSVVTAEGRVTVVHATGDDLKSRAEGIGQQDSLASFLALYNNDKSCMAARIRGEGVVAGRAVYEIAVEPNPGRCDAELASEPGSGGKQPPASDEQSVDQKAVQEKAQKALKTMVIWVDKETYLPLKTAMYDQSGAVIEESEATSVQYDVTFPDSTFTYTPPAGVKVIEASDKESPGTRG